MNANLTSILEYKTSKVEVDKLKFLDVLNKELLKFNFEEDYLKEGTPTIENASEVTFYTCLIENFTDTRSMSESNRPNRSGVPMGNKRFSEFNIWDYKLSYKKEFHNSSDSHDITESHHAIGCGTCKQQGKIRCSSCRGAGDVTCSSCSGRGQKQCSNCNGRVDIKCWSCSGKGTKETGYGENKRTERCSSCSGRGSNKCTRCSNGFITCSTCSGGGKVTCYTCNGSGEVTCYQCDGCRTMDHYFIVTASFVNLSQSLFLTNSYPGFDQNKSQINNFNIQNKLFDICENKFKEGYFEEIRTSPFYSQITSFFDFTNNESSKLIKSRINFFENKYSEVTFSFYGEKYVLYFDKNLDHSYYGGKKPSDQYELDLLKKALQSSVKNELSVTKKTIQKLAKYDFISISEKEIISAIEDTENIYEAHNEYKSKNYSSAESILRLVSNIKKSEDDFVLLRKKLNRVYFINTLILWIIGSPFIFYLLQDKAIDFVFLNVSIAVGLLLFSLLLNKGIKNIHYARFIVIVLLGVHFLLLNNFIDTNGEKILSQGIIQEREQTVLQDFNTFKSNHYIFHYEPEGKDNRDDKILFLKNSGYDFTNSPLILIEQTSISNRRYFLEKGITEKMVYSSVPDKVVKSRTYLRMTGNIDESIASHNDYNLSVRLQEFYGGPEFYIPIKDISFYDEVGIKCLEDDISLYKEQIFDTIYIPTFIYEKIKNGEDITKYNLKSIPAKAFRNSSEFDKEVEKWKQELYDNGEVGKPCREDNNWQKWIEDNPGFYFGQQKVESIETDYNSDGIKDGLFYFPAENCVAGNGTASNFGMLVYSENGEYLTNKKITNTIETKIKNILFEKGFQKVYLVYIHYKGFAKTISGEYYAWSDKDASCCPSNSGTFEYNPKDSKMEINNKTDKKYVD